MSARGQAAARRTLVAGTRGSALAMWQTRYVLGLLRERWPEIEWDYRIYSTRGDRELLRSLSEIGGRGAFTETLEAAMANREIEFAVHSLKDLPTEADKETVVAAIVGPRNPGEILISKDERTLDSLPTGATVGTSSLRRRAQLLAVRPDLEVRDIRGNVETRIAKVRGGEYDATLLAAAGVERLGLRDEVSDELSPEIMLPAPGQGAIAVQCRAEDERLIALFTAVDDAVVRSCVTAEREFLGALGGGCSAPVGALAERVGNSSSVRLIGRVIAPDGSSMVEGEESGSDPREVGRRLARRLQAQGAERILHLSSERGEGPLAGRTIVVTRRKEQSARLVHLLEEAGAAVRVLPTIGIEGLENAVVVDRLGDFNWILFTSRNAVEHFLKAAKSGFPASTVKVAAVGAATARALEETGVRPDFVASDENAKGLAEELPIEPGMQVLYPCAQRHTGDIEELLERRQARVECLPVYRTVPQAVGTKELQELEQGVDWVLFTSGSTVEGFLSSFGGRGPESRRGFEHTRYASIGATTARVAEERGLSPVIVGEEPSAEGLVDAVIKATVERKL